jgi:hypothetical protein
MRATRSSTVLRRFQAYLTIITWFQKTDMLSGEGAHGRIMMTSLRRFQAYLAIHTGRYEEGHRAEKEEEEGDHDDDDDDCDDDGNDDEDLLPLHGHEGGPSPLLRSDDSALEQRVAQRPRRVIQRAEEKRMMMMMMMMMMIMMMVTTITQRTGIILPLHGHEGSPSPLLRPDDSALEERIPQGPRGVITEEMRRALHLPTHDTRSPQDIKVRSHR